MSRDVLLTLLLPACLSDAAGAGPGPSSTAANAARAGGGAAAVNAGQSAAAARLFEKVQVLSHTLLDMSHTVSVCNSAATSALAECCLDQQPHQRAIPL